MFGKLFTSFLDSSVNDLPVSMRFVWCALISLADANGNVAMTDAALARRLNLPMQDVEAALEKLSAEDPRSTSPDENGRRIVRLEDGHGWRLVNHSKYRGMRDSGDRQRQNREAQQRRRAKSAEVSQRQPQSAQADTEADTEAEAEINARAGGQHTRVGSAPPSTRRRPPPRTPREFALATVSADGKNLTLPRGKRPPGREGKP